MFPAIGSISTAAISFLFFSNAFSTASPSLNGTSTVFAVIGAGTPGELGTPCVSAPLPASTKSASLCPW